MRKKHIAAWLAVGFGCAIATGIACLVLRSGIVWLVGRLGVIDPATFDDLGAFVQFAGVSIGVTYLVFRTFSGAFNVDLTLEASAVRAKGGEVFVSLTLKKGPVSGVLVESIWTRFRVIGEHADGKQAPVWTQVDRSTFLEVATLPTSEAKTAELRWSSQGITISPCETYNLAFGTVLETPEAHGILDILVVAQRAPIAMGTSSQWRVSVPVPPPRLTPEPSLGAAS